MFNNFSEKNQPLLAEKIARLEKEWILETRVDERLRLEHKINELKGKSSFAKIPKINKDQYTIGIFILLVTILAIWMFLEKNINSSIFQSVIFYLGTLGGGLFIINSHLLTFIEKQVNKAQNKI